MDNEIQLISDGDGLAVIGIRRMSNASSSRRGCSRSQSAVALLGAAGPGKVTMPSSVRGPLVDGPALCAPGTPEQPRVATFIGLRIRVGRQSRTCVKHRHGSAASRAGSAAH